MEPQEDRAAPRGRCPQMPFAKDGQPTTQHLRVPDPDQGFVGDEAPMGGEEGEPEDPRSAGREPLRVGPGKGLS